MLLSAHRQSDQSRWVLVPFAPHSPGCVFMQGVFRNVQSPGWSLIQPVDARQPACGRESCEVPNREDRRQTRQPTNTLDPQQDNDKTRTRVRPVPDSPWTEGESRSLSEVEHTSSDAISDASKQMTCMSLLVDLDRPGRTPRIGYLRRRLGTMEPDLGGRHRPPPCHTYMYSRGSGLTRQGRRTRTFR